jgi:nicotinamide mononucleotide transporter
MNSFVVDWVTSNWVEVIGSILGISYVFLSIKQNILTWLLGFLTSALYIYVFFVSKFYADMALQFYYVWVSIYGWMLWTGGIKTKKGRKPLPVRKLSLKLGIKLLAVACILWLAIFFVLKYFTDSPVPFGDAFTTAFSIVATWMLAQKILEHWIAWVVVDVVSLILYLYKGLYPTSVMFVIYTLAAVWGYTVWKKDMQKNERATA